LKTGKSLEKLIFELEKALSANENVQIESPKKYRDKVTGKLREYDVVLTIKEKHHEVTVAIECRDRSRPITVGQVEGFYTKLQHTGIDKGVIVSPKGFYNTARKKAEHLGIRCLDIEQVDTLPWVLTSGVQSFSRSIKHTDWTLIPQQDFKNGPTDFSLVDSAGNEVKAETLNRNLADALDELLPIPDKLGSDHAVFSFDGNDLFVRDKISGEDFPLKQLIANVEYVVTNEVRPFEFHKYSDKDSGVNITDVAVAKLDFGALSGKLMIVYKQDEGGKVLFVRDDKSKDNNAS